MYNPYYAYAAGDPGGFNITSPTTLLMLGGAGLTVASVLLDFMFKGDSKIHALMFFSGLGAAGIGAYLTFAPGFNLPTITNKVINPVDVAQGGLDGIWKWLQGYSPYIFGAGALFYLMTFKAKKGFLAGPIYLASILMMLGGGAMIISNFGGLAELPNIGQGLQNVIHPKGPTPLKIPTTGTVTDLAQYSRSYATTPDVILPRQIITGKGVLGSRNPVDDNNHIYSNISDVY